MRRYCESRFGGTWKRQTDPVGDTARSVRQNPRNRPGF